MSSQAYNSGHRHRERSGYAGQNGRQQWVPGSSGFTNTLASSFDAYPTNYGGEMNVDLVPVGRPTRGIPGVMDTPASSFNVYPSNYGGEINIDRVPMDRPGRGILNTPSNFNAYQGANGGELNNRLAQTDRGYRGYRGPRGGRSHMGRPQNHRVVRTEAREGGLERGNEDNKRTSHRREENVNLDLPQLVQEIQDKLTKGLVECMICYDMVKRTSPIWSCSSCFSIFHLNCIKKWARAPTSVDNSAEKSQGFNWRCPGCQSVQLKAAMEIHYICFCGKRRNPPSDLYLTPHSCGEPCGRPLEREATGTVLSKEDFCPHVCVLQCHPGPCPPCKAFAPPRPCPCGKKAITTRCSDRKSVHMCGQLCDKLLDCERHRCDRVCHMGPCEPCKVPINASCFCRKTSELLLCGDVSTKGEIRANVGVFLCGSTCAKKLECGNHQCAEVCHLGPCGECELVPNKVNTCFCGNKTLKDQRKSCLDPIPTCTGTCGKRFSCSLHQCKEKCHGGPCPPCGELVTQKCRCGSTSQTVECYKTTLPVEKFVCYRSCGRKKNCGRHRCSERCCPLFGSSETLSSDWNPHFCSLVCGKKLGCKQHSCESFCHSGHCPPCLETIFTDLTCACGRNSIPPPLPCGTPPPSCQYACSILQRCGHQSTHSCHFGDCPPCIIPIAKECIGGHVVLRNIPCGSKDIRCNKLCEKTRCCGLHACRRTCHAPPCDPPSNALDRALRASCGQTCAASRRDCEHTCKALCHPRDPCPDVRCEFPVTITCSCGRISAAVPCDVGGGTLGFNADNVLAAAVLQKLPVPLQPVEANDERVPLGQRKLVCDDLCSKLEMKRVLADAFDISLLSLDALHSGENPAVSEMLAELLRRDPKWVLTVEERCRHLVLGKNKAYPSNVRVHVFCAVPKEKRDAIRLIAERWRLSVSTTGWEPKRFIVVHATSKSRAPTQILGSKGAATMSPNHPSIFHPLVDMDPRLVVALLDRPDDADINTLVLRFGGECELVWLNDKSALAVFSDTARAATAMRRLDNGSVYQGAVFVQKTNVSPALNGNPWKRTLVKESKWVEDSWGDEERSVCLADAEPPSFEGRVGPITTTINRWAILNPDSTSTSAEPPTRVVKSGKHKAAQKPPISKKESGSASMNPAQVGGIPAEDSEEIPDGWEKAYD